jgi:exodeoxyribonuclease V gamma subunit
LRIARRHPGDINPSERDRYLFLEAILAARDRIAFSWVERDAQTGDLLFPSTTLRELQSILLSYTDESGHQAMTTSHPVSRYEAKYFEDIWKITRTDMREDLAGFDPEAHRGARMLAMRAHLQSAVGGRVLPPKDELLEKLAPELRADLAGSLGLIELPEKPGAKEDEIDLPLAAVRRFLECPLQGAARYALGMIQEEDATEDTADEPIAQSRLDHALLLRQAFWTARGDPAAFRNAYQEAMAVAQMRGCAPAGPFAEAAVQADCVRFARWCQELGDVRVGLGEWRVLRIGRGDEFARADRVLPPLRLDVRIADAGGAGVVRRINLHGSLGAFSPALDRSLRLVTRAKAKALDFLELFIAAIALSAAGEEVAEEFEGTVLGDPAGTSRRAAASWSKSFRPPRPPAAREYLAGLIGEMMSGVHDYFLPIEAVDAARRALATGRDPLDQIENIRDGFGPCSSNYGPVRNARDYEPPDEREIVAIVERRYGPIAAIFDDRSER